jgi:hypothetical protein
MRVLVAKQQERIKELEDDLKGWISQYGCNCGHPHCAICKDVKYTNELINKTKVKAIAKKS